MFAVFMFGRTLEQVWGSKRFLGFYFITGLGAAITQMLVVYLRVQAMKQGMADEAISQVYTHGYQLLHENMNFTNMAQGSLNLLMNTVTIGASGAVFGILLAFGMLFPNAELFIIPFPFPIKAKWFVLGYGAIELFFGISNFSGDNVAHFAHLGGMIFGIFAILYWKKKDRGYGRYY
jgi:membrane associated rhomboid family serine protease